MPNPDDVLGQTEPVRPHHGRRRFVRYPINLPVTAQAAQFPGRGLHGTVRDIGRGGLMAEFPVALVPGSVVELRLQTLREPLEEAGRVVWVKTVKSGVHHGFAFSEPKARRFAADLYRQVYPEAPEGSGGRLNDERTEGD